MLRNCAKKSGPPPRQKWAPENLRKAVKRLERHRTQRGHVACPQVVTEG